MTETNEFLRSRNWRARAEECRAMAEWFENQETRQKMLRIAADYDQMAEKAESEAVRASLKPAGRHN